MLDLEVVLNKLYSIIDRKKQNTLTAGENITIVDDVISATGGGSGDSYTAGNGISIDNKIISAKVDNSTIKFDENGVMYSENGESQIEYHAGIGLELDDTTHTFHVDDSIATVEQIENETIARQQAYNQLDESKQDTLTAGENIQINNSVISATNTTYSDATENTHGLMSASDKSKLNGVAAGAEVNVQSDWNATSGDAFIKNKPSIPNAANNGKLVITQNGVEVGQFTADSSQDETISLTDTNTEYNAGDGLVLNNNIFDVDYTKIQKILSATDGLSLSDDTISLASKSYTTSTFPWRDTQNERDVPSFNKVYQEGTYALSLYGAGNYSSVANTIGFPLVSDSTIYGELIVSRAYSTSRYIQIYIYTPSSTASYRTRTFFRSSYNNTGSWKDWREVASLDDIANLDINSLSLEVSATDYPWWVEL